MCIRDSNYLIQSAGEALARQPDLAAAYFVRAWGGFLADPGDPKVRQDLARTAALAPSDPLFAAAAAPGAIVAPPLSSSEPKRIQFARGATSATVNGELARRGIDRYILTAMAGQAMQVDVNSPAETVVLAIQGEDGTILLNRGNGETAWSGVLSENQDYIVSVISTGSADGYSLTITIPPLKQ